MLLRAEFVSFGGCLFVCMAVIVIWSRGRKQCLSILLSNITKKHIYKPLSWISLVVSNKWTSVLCVNRRPG